VLADTPGQQVLVGQPMQASLIMLHESSILDKHGIHAAMVTIIYHKKLTAEWKTAAEELRSLLTSAPSSSGIVQVIGRSRKQKIELFTSHVDEVMTVAGKRLHYRQVEGAFSQPNGGDNLLFSSCSSSANCCFWDANTLRLAAASIAMDCQL
jgi:tRNA/tmRNA/rRNA uracil-C5-methylase (TrmA/RlmC/RlmD family)